MSDLYAPVSGEVIEVNSGVTANVQLLAEDPYDKGWLIKLKVDDPPQTAELLDLDAYEKQGGRRSSLTAARTDRLHSLCRDWNRAHRMAYIANTPDDVRVMLGAIGLDSLDQLFDMIPPSSGRKRPARDPAGA